MVIENLYTFEIKEVEEGKITAVLQFDKEHPVYRGHFPQTPVTPGVVQMLVVKELLQEALGRKLQMTQARDIKFLSMHVPSDEKLKLVVNYQYKEETLISVKAEMSDKERIILKLNGEYKSA